MDSIVTVVTPAANTDLTTTVTVKLLLGISGSGEDTKIAEWIKQASAFINSYCNRQFAKQTVSEQFRVETSRRDLLLSIFPVVSITSVNSGDNALVVADDTEVDKTKGIIYRISGSSYMNWGCYKTTVVYEAGYDVPTATPSDLIEACVELIKSARSAATRDPLAKRIEIPDVETVDYWVGGIGESSFGLPAKVKATLDNYRKHH